MPGVRLKNHRPAAIRLRLSESSHLRAISGVKSPVLSDCSPIVSRVPPRLPLGRRFQGRFIFLIPVTNLNQIQTES